MVQATIVFIYIDDIIFTGNNENEINKVKIYLKNKFDIKDLEKLKYLLEIKIITFKREIFIFISKKICS
jgi:Reverse transcriptase (RNA-dependent DNA polymerase)